MSVGRHMDEAAFLDSIAPRLGLRAVGFRRNLNQVFKRVRRRMVALRVADLAAYRAYLDAHRDEWAVLDAMCRVTISRFFRDVSVWERIRSELMHRWRGDVTAWSLGCASGEEPYSLAIAWATTPYDEGTRLRIVAVDADAALIGRARRGVFRASSLREMPSAAREAGVIVEGDVVRVRDELRASIDWRVMDLRRELPDGNADLVMCRNTVFTYFASDAQQAFLRQAVSRLRDGAWLVVGREEVRGDVRAAMREERFEDHGGGVFVRR